MTEDEMMRKYAEAHGCGEEISAGDIGRCGWCGSVNGTRYLKKEGCWECADCGVKWIKTPLRDIKKNSDSVTDYPQAHEKNEYRYLSPDWLDEMAKGLTAGQEKYPGETWRQIPAKEHAWRAIRHLMLYLKGDKADTHIINASMRCMMCFETDAAENSTIEWERLMREKGCG